MNDVKIFPLGGMDELGKNMLLVEVNDVIFIIECGIKIPDASLLGVEYVVPDFSYLLKNKNKIGGIFITHAHDDVMRALPYLIKQLDIPIYTTKFTAMFLRDLLKKEQVRKYKIKEIEKNSSIKIKGIKIELFSVTHSFPDTFGLAIKTNQGYIVYSGEATFDYDTSHSAFYCNINQLSEIGEKGVLCLLSESQAADREGHTAPKHLIKSRLESLFETTNSRIIVGCYRQSLYRILEILDVCKEFNKKVFIPDTTLLKTLEYLEKCGYYKRKKGMILTTKNFKNDLDDVVVLVTGRGKRLFLKLSMIAMHEDKYVDLRESDTVIVTSPAINGTERDAVNMENEIYKEGAKVHMFKAKEVYSMHPSKEDLKMLIHLFKPKYYLPIKGEYRHLIANANIGSGMGYSDNNIIILDNGQSVEFKNKKAKVSNKILKLEDMLIDGNENWDVTGVVLKDREVLSTDGVIIIGVTVDNKKYEIQSGIDIQTRGLVYLKDADYLLKEVEKITRDTINEEVKKETYDNFECRNMIRDKVSKYVFKETGKRPMILPVILEVKK